MALFVCTRIDCVWVLQFSSHVAVLPIHVFAVEIRPPRNGAHKRQRAPEEADAHARPRPNRRASRPVQLETLDDAETARRGGSEPASTGVVAADDFEAARASAATSNSMVDRSLAGSPAPLCNGSAEKDLDELLRHLYTHTDSDGDVVAAGAADAERQRNGPHSWAGVSSSRMAIMTQPERQETTSAPAYFAESQQQPRSEHPGVGPIPATQAPECEGQPAAEQAVAGTTLDAPVLECNGGESEVGPPVASQHPEGVEDVSATGQRGAELFPATQLPDSEEMETQEGAKHAALEPPVPNPEPPAAPTLPPAPEAPAAVRTRHGVALSAASAPAEQLQPQPSSNRAASTAASAFSSDRPAGEGPALGSCKDVGPLAAVRKQQQQPPFSSEQPSDALPAAQAAEDAVQRRPALSERPASAAVSDVGGAREAGPSLAQQPVAAAPQLTKGAGAGGVGGSGGPAATGNSVGGLTPEGGRREGGALAVGARPLGAGSSSSTRRDSAGGGGSWRVGGAAPPRSSLARLAFLDQVGALSGPATAGAPRVLGSSGGGGGGGAPFSSPELLRPQHVVAHVEERGGSVPGGGAGTRQRLISSLGAVQVGVIARGGQSHSVTRPSVESHVRVLGLGVSLGRMV